MEGSLAEEWYAKFMETLPRHDASTGLRDAALKVELAPWTQALTAIVVGTCEGMGWKSAARGHRSSLLPVPRQEYLGLDVVAFEPAGDRRWRFPVAVFKLENSLADDRVAYSLWKVLCVRAQLRVVFCYREDSTAGSKLVRHLGTEVAQAIKGTERPGLVGDTLLVVGSRNESRTFPYGFFKEWLFDANLGRFGRA
jgi:hypothetical protein